MNLRTRNQQRVATVQAPVILENDDGLKELVRATVIKGLNSSSHRRVYYQAKIQLTSSQADVLKRAYNLGYRLKESSHFMDDFRVIRANFATFYHYSKIKEDSFKIAIRNSRVVNYNCHGNGQLKTKSIHPPPYMVIAFKRSDCRLNMDANDV